jgi:plastocyanin
MMISIPLGLALATLPGVLAATYDVSVGDGVLRYNPQTVHAVAGDIVNFVL